jgi:neutral ceramidase
LNIVNRLGLFALLSMTAWTLPAHAQDTEKVFKAGVAKMNITPWLGLSIVGYMHDRKVEAIHDEINVRSLVLDDGANALAFAVVDSCAVSREIMDSAKQRAHGATGLPMEHMLISATHTHSAPCTFVGFQSQADPEYDAFLARRIADGIYQAWRDRIPARIGWGSGSVPDEVFNRRWFMKEGSIGADPFGKIGDTVRMNPPGASPDMVKPAGPTDPEVAFMALETTEGKPLGLLANYSLHYVGGTKGTDISADYFGLFSEEIGRLLGASDSFLAMMSNGTSGDINNINFVSPRGPRKPYEQMNIVANKVAAEVYRAYLDIEFQDWVPLKSVQKEIALGVRKPTTEDVAEAKALLAAAEGRALRGLREIYANETVALADYPEQKSLILQAFQIGDLGVAAIPCEVFVDIGLAIKAQTPFKRSFTIELANGCNGYLPTEEQHQYGGYETWRAKSSYLEVKAGTVVQQTVLELLAELKG